MALAIFDLDNTLIGCDSDYAWTEYLVEKGWVDGQEVGRLNQMFYEQYQQGTLNIDQYLKFSLSFLAGKSTEHLAKIHQDFMRCKIEPHILPKALQLIGRHRQQGDRLLVITATNRFITEPIVAKLGIPELIACDAEIIDGCYTGLPLGVPSFAQGKVIRLKQWLEINQMSLDGAFFYSDSHNDLPLLRLVDNPVAVNPDNQLYQVAQDQSWRIVDLR